MTNEFDIKLGARLKELRLYHGYTQQAIGEVLGVTFQQVQKYEAGANRVTARTLHALKSFYAIRWDDFFFRADIPALPAIPTPDLERNISVIRLLATINSKKIQQAIFSLMEEIVKAGGAAQKKRGQCKVELAEDA